MFAQRIKSLQLHKKKPIVILTAVFVLLIIPCLVMLIKPGCVVSSDVDYSFTPGERTDYVTVYSDIALPRGVYDVALYYEAQTEGTAPLGHCILTDATVFEGGLLTNGEHLYAEQTATDYQAWLFEDTDHLNLQVAYDGNGSLRLTGYTLTETGLLWSMLLTCICFVFGLLYAGVIYFYYNREYPVAAQKKKVFFFVLVFSFLASLPYFRNDNLAGIDLTYHLHRIEGLKTGLLTGQFPVRIEPEWLFGHGYAAGVFYCNILLLFPAVLRMLGFTTLFSYNAYCIALTVATAAIAYYCFAKLFRDSDIGIICSALYTLSTFRIYKLVNTSAIGEAGAVTFMPLVLYGMYRVFSENPKDKQYRTAWMPVALGYAGLMQTHVLSCEITAFLTVIVCIAGLKKVFRKETFLQLAKGALGAIGLSLWFLVPFLDYYFTQDVHIKNLTARTIQRTGLTLAHLLFEFWGEGEFTPGAAAGVYHTYPVGMGLVLILGLFVFLALWYSGKLPGKKAEVAGVRPDAAKELRTVTFFAKVCTTLGILLLFMSTAYFPWDAISKSSALGASLVSSLEFTHRVLGWGNAFLVAVTGYVVWYLKQKGGVIYPIGVVVTMVSLLVSSVLLLEINIQTGNFYKIYHEEGMSFGFVSDGEYLIEGTDSDAVLYAAPKTSEGVTVSAYEKGNLKASFYGENRTGAEGYVEVPLLLYKGYRAVCKEDGRSLPLEYGTNYDIRVLLPAAFQGTVQVRFVSPFYWRIAEVISLLCALWMIGIFVRRNRRAEA